jgi:hypothetical protein
MPDVTYNFDPDNRDYLSEAKAIAKGETMMLGTTEHVKAQQDRIERLEIVLDNLLAQFRLDDMDPNPLDIEAVKLSDAICDALAVLKDDFLPVHFSHEDRYPFGV